MTIQEYLDYLMNTPVEPLLNWTVKIFIFALVVDLLIYGAIYLWWRKKR